VNANRFISTVPSQNFNSETSSSMNYLLAIAAGLGIYTLLTNNSEAESKAPLVDYEAVKADIRQVLADPNKEDTWGPVFVRLAWHASGTYSQFDLTGGSNGATMRFCPESRHGANNGLGIARDALEPVKRKHPSLSYADLWVLASIVAIKEMGGPDINFTPGRSDARDGRSTPPEGRLPDANRNADHIRAIFYRMGFSDREIVALLGAHALGRCHRENSGFVGAWTHSPDVFSNDFFVQLLNEKWEKVELPNGNYQFNDPKREIMMLPSDMELVTDPDFHRWTVAFANDEELFFHDFAAAYEKLVNFNLYRK
jgi:catalase (peroxidase I)